MLKSLCHALSIDRVSCSPDSWEWNFDTKSLEGSEFIQFMRGCMKSA